VPALHVGVVPGHNLAVLPQNSATAVAAVGIVVTAAALDYGASAVLVENKLAEIAAAAQVATAAVPVVAAGDEAGCGAGAAAAVAAIALAGPAAVVDLADDAIQWTSSSSRNRNIWVCLDSNPTCIKVLIF